MTRIALLLAATVLLGAAGCGGAADEEPARMQPSAEPAAQGDPGAAVDKDRAGADDPGGVADRDGTKVNVGASDFGAMLFDSSGQAIYVFERDPKRRSVCYGECAEAWPPVYTDGAPVAGKGVRARLLGTIERRGGRLQVTYAGKPLYFYAHERPGQVLCHDVNLNGGYWWVVGPDGRRRS